MKNRMIYPLDIQMFAEGDGAGNQTPPAETQQTQSTIPSIDYDKLAEVVSKRSNGTEERVLQGYFKDQGLNPEQAKEAIGQYKQAQITKKQEEAQQLQKMKDENVQLKAQIINGQIDAKVAELSASLGVQADKLPFLNKLVDRTKATKEDGALNDDNIKAAVEEVLKVFPDFKSTAQAGGFQQIGANGQGSAGGSGTNDQLDAIFGVMKK